MNLDNFKPIPEYPEYLVSRDGEVWSTKSNKFLKPRACTTGRDQVAVCDRGKVKFLLVSRIVCRVWGDLDSLLLNKEVDHIDGNKRNNHYKNLQALTSEEHWEKTFGGPIRSKECPSCGNRKSAASSKCRDCTVVNPSISVEDIETLVLETNWVQAAKKLGLSDNGLRKRYKRLSGKDPKNLKKQR